MSPSTLLLALCVAAAPILRPASAAAVMSVDLGTEFMKVAVVSPGVPMEIALNPESKRKTSVAVAMRDGERTFGSDALAVAVKHPKNCYVNVMDVLGKKFDHPQVALYRKLHPYYDMKAHPERGTVLFQHDENTVFSPEELLSMVLQHAKQMAEDFTQQKVKDVVVTVPAYFNQAERRAMAAAVDLAGLTLLQLMSEPMAVSLNYGMFRRKEINETVRNLMFYDMGSRDTVVSIVAFQVIKTKERGFTETHPQAQILGVGFDRNLGASTVQFRLRDYLAEKFNDMKKTKTDVRSVPRAMAKLLKEAARVKTVLSANAQMYSQVENVMEDIDFKLEITRDTLHELNEDFFARVSAPIDQALRTSAMNLEDINEVILVGAGTRIPRVQEILLQRIGKELGKNLNTDEAAAMGAVYKAADLSTGFKVKKFITKDALLFPIDVDFEREVETDEGSVTKKQVKRSLFGRMNAFPQKKIMTFNKHVDDFTFAVNINDLDHLPEEERNNVGSLNLTEVDVTGVAEAFAKYAEVPNVESKGIKAHFNLDESGLLHVTAVEVVFEKTISVEEQEAEEKKESDAKAGEAKDENAWANLGDTISNFFNKENAEKSGTGKESTEKTDSNDDAKDAKDAKEGKDGKEKNGEAKKDEKPAKKKEPKIETIKEALNFTVRVVDLPDMSAKLLAESKEKLRLLDEHDAKKKAREGALNNLETFIIEARERMYSDIYESSITEEEKEKVEAKCAELSTWLEEEVTFETETATLESRLKELKDLTAAWYARVREHRDRPEALEALRNMLNSSEFFLAKARNSTGEDGFFTVAEVETLEKKLADITKWRDEAVEEQDKQPMHEMPKLTASLVAEKGLELDREVKYLVNKAKIAKAEKEREKKLKEAEEKKAKDAEEKKKKKGKKGKKASNGTEEEQKEEAKEKPEGAEDEAVLPDIEEEAPASEEDVLPNGDDSILPEDGGESPESVFSHEEDAKEESSEKTEEEETTRTETHTEL